MTLGEFSNGFDILVHSYTRFRDFDKKEPVDTVEFDEYEKSLFLTKAQEELVLSLYTGRNSSGLSFEETEEMRRYLSNLVTEVELTPNENDNHIGMNNNSAFFKLPDNLWFITYEAAKVSDAACEGMMTQDIIPVRQDEYHKIKRNPFRGTTARRALRLDFNDNTVELVSRKTISKYYIRYINKIRPIVLVDLPNGLSIGGISVATNCCLHESIHQKILENAVVRALQSKGYNLRQDNSNNENN